MVKYTLTFDHPDDPLAFRLESEPPNVDLRRLLWALTVLEREATTQALSLQFTHGRQEMHDRLVAAGEDQRLRGNEEAAQTFLQIAAIMEAQG